MIDFCIVGTGIAGSTISNLLNRKYSLKIIDKARGIGGRSSNRRLNKDLTFDHGVQYISSKTKGFNSFLKRLEKKNFLKEWSGNHINFSSKEENKKKYIGVNGNNDICRYLLKNQKVVFRSAITKIIFNGSHWTLFINKKKIFSKAVILTLPYDQTDIIAGDVMKNSFKNLKIKMLPNFTIMAAFKNNFISPLSSIKFDEKYISWAANENSKKRFKSDLNLWTIQLSTEISKKALSFNKRKKRKLMNFILKIFTQKLGYNYKHIKFKNYHSWRYAYSFKKTSMKSYWDKKTKLGVCADWFLGPKVEDAWLSAVDLFKKIK